MQRHINIGLLKEYIKTLVAAEVVLPGILPRQWGNEFSRTELRTIHLTLKFVLQTAGSPQTNASLVEAFRQIEEPGINLHWFLCDYWEAIIPILEKYPYASGLVHKQSLQYELN